MSLVKESLKELYRDEHPGFGSYLECMTRANFTGLATFSVAFSFTYLMQSFLKKKLPYSTKGFVMSSALISAFLSYSVVKSKSKNCQEAWLAAEDKITYFTELEKPTNSS